MNNHALSQLLKSIAIGLLAMAWLPLHAQLSYVFTAQSGTYSEVSGGTDLNTIEADDVHSAAINLGFTFNFDGTNLTQVKVNSNGWLSLATGDSPSAAQGRDNSVMASANGNTRPALMPLWDDLSGTGGVAVYRTTGSSPNRVFTMEWRNWRWNYNAGGAVISFQVKLYEGSNVIEYIYRQQGTAYTGTGSTGGASIGMIASGGAYISLNGTGTNPGTSTSVATTNLTTKPANGQIYRFTPCTSPTAAYGAGITDCVSGTYTIPVNVTSLGSSASVNIVASPGGTVHSGVGIGSHIIGPLPLGTNVTVNVVGSAGCSTALAATTMNDVDATCHAASVYPIPDNGCGSNNYRDIPFCLNSTGTQLGTDVFVRSVDLIASSTYNADLELRLISPNGTTVLLVNDRFGNGDNLGNPSNCPNSLFTLRDGGTPLVSSNQSNVTGEYAPEQPLSGFHDGSDPNGTWTLRACDHYAQDLSAMRYVRVNLCSPATATVNAVPNCANGQFNVAVNVTNFGSGTSARLTYAMNGGTPIVMNGVGLGTTNLGPFPADAAVHVTVSNGLSDCGMITRSVYSNCPVTLDCGTTATVDHCYGNNDGRTFTYLSPFHGETVTINFIQGALDLNDALLVFDGADDTAPLIDGGSFYGSLGGMSFTSSGPAIHMKILANGANSCADGGQAVPWSFEAKCTPGCQAPAAFVDIFNDCGSYTFSAELMVMYAGDGASNDVVYTVNGGAPNRISGVPEWESVPFGPFTIGDEVQITVEHETDRLCDLNLGTFTNTVQCPSAENCLNTLNLATQSSPLSGTTIGRVNDFSIACAPATANTARDAIYFIDVPRYQQLRIRQQSNNYDSQHYVRYGGACPGTTAIACVDDADSEIGWVNWVNTTGGTQRVWWIQDGYGSNAGNFVLEWDLVGCPATTAAAATTILSNSAYANFTYLTGDYVIEYGPSATFTTPGTAALPGPNGTVITAGASPFQITG
ncbi:MAG: proprotein convertase P-domain-containing protein, partial [Flavobacteriales bacterium]|nr:proprotein convertase P-domain-containing protein [Flavobacteriales bacterium]